MSEDAEIRRLRAENADLRRSRDQRKALEHRLREEDRREFCAAMRELFEHEKRLTGGAIAESPARDEVQAARDYGVMRGIQRCIDLMSSKP